MIIFYLCTMKWIGDRISFNDKKEYVTFIIYPPQIGQLKKTLIILWTLLWYAVGAAVFSQLFFDYEEKEKIMMIVFLSFWLYYAFRVTRTLIYLTYGREYIKLDKHALRIKRATGKYGKAEQYFLESIQKFEIVELKENSFQAVYENSPWIRGTNKIQFEYIGKTISFGRKLTEKDAKLFYNFLVKRIQQYLRQKDKE